jgi:XTP/dITP diphosphohydrolase
MQLLIGTNNKGKFIEISEVLRDLELELLTPQHLDIETDPAETGASFVENAIQKAQHYFDASGLPTIADDSGIEIDALKGELGIHTRRWGVGADATDEEWIEYFLKRMHKEENKKARFICSLAYIDTKGELHTFEGACEGIITEDLESEYLPGLPISACFKPKGYEAVFSELSLDQKNSTSHRGRAVKEFKEFIGKQLH